MPIRVRDIPYAYDPIRVWDGPYAYGMAHTRMGQNTRTGCNKHMIIVCAVDNHLIVTSPISINFIKVDLRNKLQRLTCQTISSTNKRG